MDLTSFANVVGAIAITLTLLSVVCYNLKMYNAGWTLIMIATFIVFGMWVVIVFGAYYGV